MARRTKSAVRPQAAPADKTGVVVGWTHNDLGSSIDLRIQSATSRQALDNDSIDSHHFLMTHNQALLLAKYLLDSTHQSLPPRTRPPLWKRILSGWNK